MPPKVQRVGGRRVSARLNPELEGGQAIAKQSLKPKGVSNENDKGYTEGYARDFLKSKGLQPIMDTYGSLLPHPIHPILNSKVMGGTARVNKLFDNHSEGAGEHLNMKRQKNIENLANTKVGIDHGIDQRLVGNQKRASDHNFSTNGGSKKIKQEHVKKTTSMSKGSISLEIGNKQKTNDHSSQPHGGFKKTTKEQSKLASDNNSPHPKGGADQDDGNEDIVIDHGFPTNGDTNKTTLDGQISENNIPHVDKPTSKGHVGRKKRGKTRMLETWGRPSNLPLIILRVNGKGVPIGKEAGPFAEWLGSVARNGQYCPLDVETWHKMPKQKKEDVMDLVKARYDITLLEESFILSSVASKWRTFKNYLKSKYWTTNSMEYNVEGEDADLVSIDQWFKLLEYWNNPKTMEMCERNKIARSKRLMNHATGKKPYANVEEDLEVYSRANMFEKCFIRKKDTPENVLQAWGKMQELQKEQPEGEEDLIAPNDIYAQVLGKDKPGRVRMVECCMVKNILFALLNFTIHLKRSLE